MYQTTTGCPEEFFREVTQQFYQMICSKDNLNVSKEAFDLSVPYIVNYACAWNRLDRVGKTCHIIAKDDRIAHVMFEGESVECSASHFYRLEDLSRK